MNEIDKFVKEKLDLLNDISKLDYTPPDMSKINRQIVKMFVDYCSARRKKRPRKTKKD